MIFVMLSLLQFSKFQFRTVWGWNSAILHSRRISTNDNALHDGWFCISVGILILWWCIAYTPVFERNLTLYNNSSWCTVRTFELFACTRMLSNLTWVTENWISYDLHWCDIFPLTMTSDLWIMDLIYLGSLTSF